MHTLPIRHLAALLSPATLFTPTLCLAALAFTLPARAQQVGAQQAGAQEAGRQQAVIESPDAGAIRANPADELEYAWVPAGTFQMGCVPADTECDEDEKPRHAVTLSAGFWIGRTEVTVAAYEKFTSASGLPMPEAPEFNAGWRRKTHPIVRVSWSEAQAYCTWAGGSLPTEAQYEYAARGGQDGQRFSWGNDTGREHANFEGVEGFDRWENTAPGGEFPANDYGLHDLAGNVYEWTADWYHPSYYAQSSATDPRGPEEGTERVLRGGSWFTVPRVLRASDRFKYVPVAQDNSLGFRCTLSELP